jgi:hypothetical protein
MSIANFAIAETAVGDAQKSAVKKTPGKRTATAIADQRLAPEPR